MDLNQFTQKSQEAVGTAQEIAIRHGHQQVDVEHLLSALATQPNGLVTRLIERTRANPGAYARAIDEELDKLPKVSGPGAAPNQIVVTQRLNQTLVGAKDLADSMNDEFISVEHLFLKILEETESTPAGRVNKAFGLSKDKVLGVLT
ncbi:MAG: type VI secretion system ATPase TssH, partial [Desulfovibrio sp.]